MVLRNHFLRPICHLLHKDKELLVLRNNFRATKKFLIAIFDCTFNHVDRNLFLVPHNFEFLKTPFLQVMGKNFMLTTSGTVWDFSLPHWQLTSWSMDFCMTQAVSLEVRFLLGLDLRFFKISCQNDKRIIGIKFWSVWYQIIEVQLDSCAHGQLTCDDNFFQKYP